MGCASSIDPGQPTQDQPISQGQQTTKGQQATEGQQTTEGQLTNQIQKSSQVEGQWHYQSKEMSERHLLSGEEEVALVAAILQGDILVASQYGSHALKVFISSTFTDTKAERNYLMKEIYPRLKHFCNNRGVDFSVVDMRWGIRDTATNDHMTNEICMAEINRCHHKSLPAPCFVYLGCNRYGTPGLSRLVKATEFEQLLQLITDSDTLNLIQTWYKKDENAIPPQYVLQPISSQMPEFIQAETKEEKREIRQKWMEVDNKMLTSLVTAAQHCESLSPEALQKWVTSVTHQEVQLGVLDRDPATACHQALCIYRDIQQFEDDDFIANNSAQNPMVRRFIDLTPDNGVDQVNKEQIKKLRQILGDMHIPYDGYRVEWTQEGVTEKFHHQYIQHMAEGFYDAMTSHVKAALACQPRLDEVTVEVATHGQFCSKRAQAFYGRSQLLGLGSEYLSAGADSLCVVYGISGSGKTSLMAKLAEKAYNMYKDRGTAPLLVVRFCGITAKSSTAREILSSMSQQIARAFSHSPGKALQEIPSEYKELITYFKEQLSTATKDQPILIFIDSLDQLSNEDNARSDLQWLPVELPPHVHLMVSTLPDVGGCLISLRNRKLPNDRYIEVQQLTPGDNQTILTGWLTEIGRTLTPQQMKEALTKALDETTESPTVLRLKLIFDVASKCPSYEDLVDLPCDVHSLIQRFFEELEKNHGEVLVCHVLGVLGVSQHGLSESDLLDILAGCEEVLTSVLQYHQPPVRRVPTIVFARLRTQLGDYMVERGVAGKSVLAWYHRQFRESAQARYLSNDKVLIQKYSQILTDFYSGKTNDLFPDRGISSQPMFWKDESEEMFQFNYSYLSELPRAACQAGDLRQVVSTLCGLQFIACKCRSGLGRELLGDYLYAMDVFTDREHLATFYRFVSSKLHLIERRPELLYQVALNMPDTSLIHITAKEVADRKTLTPWSEHIPLVTMHKNKPSQVDSCVITLDSHEGAIHDLIYVTGNILSGAEDGKVIVWNSLTGVIKASIQVGSSPVSRLCVLSHTDCSLEVIVSCLDANIDVWKVTFTEESSTTSCICKWKAHTATTMEIVPCSVSNNKIHLISGFSKAIDHTSARITETGITEVKRMIVTGEIKLWNIGECAAGSSSQPVMSKSSADIFSDKHDSSGIWSLAWSPDDEFIIVGRGGKVGKFGETTPASLALCSAKTFDTSWQYEQDFGFISWLEVHSSDNGVWFVLMSCNNRNICKFGVYPSDGGVVGRKLWLQQLNESPERATMSKDKSTILFASGNKLRIHNYNMLDINPLTLKGTLQGHGTNVESVCWFDSGTMCCSGSRDGHIKVWDLNHMSAAAAAAAAGGVQPEGNVILSMCLSPDHTMLLTGSTSITTWDPINGHILSVIKGRMPTVVTTISPLGGTVATKDVYDTQVAITDIRYFKENSTEAQLRKKAHMVFNLLDPENEPIGSRMLVAGENILNFTPDGSHIIALNAHKQMFILSLLDQTSKYFKPHHPETWNSGAQFSPDGKQLLTWTIFEVKLFHFPDLAEIAHKPLYKAFSNDNLQLSSFAFDPQNKFILSGNSRGLIQIHNRANLEIEGSCDAHDGSMLTMLFLHSGKILVTSSQDKWVKVWSVKDFKEIAAYFVERSSSVQAYIDEQDSLIILCGDNVGNIKVLQTPHISTVISSGHES